MESRELSWSWVTSSQCLRHGACELIAAYLVPSASTTDSALYDGENNTETPIIILKSSTVDTAPFEPPVPILCRRGLYIAVGTSVSGILVLWRNL